MRRIFPSLLAILLCGILLITSLPVDAAGKYSLAFWRERGLMENRGCESGWSIMNVWVFDEQGNYKSNVQIYTTWGVLLGTTGHDGRCEIVLDNNNQYYEIKCADGTGATSDITPLMTGQRYPCWGHYSYEIGFLYKSDANNPGTFDTTTNCTVNLAGSSETDAPYQKSMAFSSINCADRTSDAYSLGHWSDSFGQTFVPNANRVVGVELQATIGESYPVTYYMQVLQGGPTGSPVSPVITVNNAPMMPYFQPFPANSCPVVPGQTYYLKVWRTGGMNMYQSDYNNYTAGQCYENGVPVSGRDLFGYIVCMDYGADKGTIAGSVRDNYAVGVGDARVWTSPGTYSTTTAGNGSFTLANVDPGTYTVYAQRPGYCSTQVGSVSVTANNTTNVQLTVPRATNLVQNYTFADGLTNWQASSFDLNSDGGWAVPAHTAPNWAGKVVSWGTSNGYAYQVVNGLTPGLEYDASTFIFTDSYTGSTPYSDNCRCQIGVDPTGGTNPSGTSIQWTALTSSHAHWSFVSKTFVASGTTATIFLRYSMTSAREWNKCAFDDVYLTTCQTPGIIITSGPTASSITTDSATITWTTDVPSNSRVDYGTTTSYGQYETNASNVTSHSITLTGLTADTTYHYKVTSAASGYDPVVTGDNTFATPAEPRMLRNPGFEDGPSQTAWTKFGTFDSGGTSIQSGNFFEIYPHSGTYMAGSAASWGTKNGGLYQRVTGFESGQLWKFTAWVNTYNQGSAPEDTNNRVGIDPLGGTSQTATSIAWSPRASTQYQWEQIGTCAVTAGDAMTFFLEAQQNVAVQWNLNAFDDCAIAQVQTGTIAQALGLADGGEIGLLDKVVVAGTSEIGSAFYVEEPDRSAGMRIATDLPVARGDKVNLTGTMGANADGERVLNADAIAVLQTGQTIPDPLLLTHKGLGGDAFGANTPGVWMGSGLYNVGMLVTAFGRVTADGIGYFYFDDGSALEDGSGNVGVLVDTAGLTNPTSNYAMVTGISTIRMVNGNPVRAIQPRSQADIVEF